MWADLLGPGWLPDSLSSIAILAGVIVVLKRLLAACRDPVVRPDPLQDLWKRYEQGDLTRWEFERRRQVWHGQEAAPILDREPRPGAGLPEIARSRETL